MSVPTNLKLPFFIYCKHYFEIGGLFYIFRKPHENTWRGHRLTGLKKERRFYLYNNYNNIGNYGFDMKMFKDSRIATKEEIKKGKKILREFEDKRIIEAI